MKIDYRIKKVLLQCLIKAGHYIAQSMYRIESIQYKSEINLVTEVDKNAEQMILDLIQKNFNNHGILAEESEPKTGISYKWIIDPLDGTTNYVHTFPMSVVSIACERDGVLIMGGVYDPFRKELFFAEKGRGAFLNQKRICVSTTKTLAKSLLVTGFPYDNREYADYYLKFVKGFMLKCQGFRRTGSAAMDLCYVACGRFDGFWEMKLKPWDTAAGQLIVQEAGGYISNFTGKEYSIYKPEILATNKRIHQEMLKLMKPLLKKNHIK